MTYTEFVSNHADLLQEINPATLRSWKARGTVPDRALQKLLQQGSGSVATVPALQNATEGTGVKQIAVVARDIHEHTWEYIDGPDGHMIRRCECGRSQRAGKAAKKASYDPVSNTFTPKVDRTCSVLGHEWAYKGQGMACNRCGEIKKTPA